MSVFEPFLVCRYCGHEAVFHDDPNEICNKCMEVGDFDHSAHTFVSDGGWTYPLCPECGEPSHEVTAVADDQRRVCRADHTFEMS